MKQASLCECFKALILTVLFGTVVSIKLQKSQENEIPFCFYSDLFTDFHFTLHNNSPYHRVHPKIHKFPCDFCFVYFNNIFFTSLVCFVH